MSWTKCSKLWKCCRARGLGLGQLIVEKWLERQGLVYKVGLHRLLSASISSPWKTRMWLSSWYKENIFRMWFFCLFVFRKSSGGHRGPSYTCCFLSAFSSKQYFGDCIYCHTSLRTQSVLNKYELVLVAPNEALILLPQGTLVHFWSHFWLSQFGGNLLDIGHRFY